MEADITKFSLVTSIDTCSIWNMLSSETLYKATLEKNLHFTVTATVVYECFTKRREVENSQDTRLQNLLKKEMSNGRFQELALSISDLQNESLLDERLKIGKGEVAAIALAKKINAGFQTDDKKAAKVAKKVLDSSQVYTTPHLFGYLIYHGTLPDAEYVEVKKEYYTNNNNANTMWPKYDDHYKEACRLKYTIR